MFGLKIKQMTLWAIFVGRGSETELQVGWNSNYFIYRFNG